MDHDRGARGRSAARARERLVEPCGGAQLVARLEEVGGVEADAEARVAAGGVDHRAELVEVDAHGAAGAGRVLEQEPHLASPRLSVERAQQSRAHAFEAGLEAGALVRADVGDDRLGAELLGRGHGADQGDDRLLVEVLVGRSRG